MSKFARFIAVSALIISMPVTAAPVAESPDPGEAVTAALAQYNVYGAGEALKNLVEARLPKKETGKPDPVLDRMFADVYSFHGDAVLSGGILRRIVSDPATPHIDHYRLLLATHEESIGSWATAQQYYRQIIADPKVSPEIALSATLGVSRLQMMSDPAAALATLLAARAKAVPQSMAWEVDLLIARAANMAGPGEASTASTALDRAWAEAPYGSVADSAVARVAGDRALVAGRAGDRKTLVAMLAVDRSKRDPNEGQSAMAHNLPLCGTNGITPQDVVTITVARQAPAGRPPITLAWASRPGIAAPFLLAAGQSDSLTVPDGQIATFRLRCQTGPANDFSVYNSIADDTWSWITSRGAYPGLSINKPIPDGISIATKFAQRQARYGADSVMLLPPLLRMTALRAVNYADEDARKQASANMDHILDILERNDAPASLILIWRMRSIAMAVIAQTKTAAEAQAEMHALWGKIADDPTLSLDTLYLMSIGAVQTPNMPSAFKITMLDDALHLLSRKTSVEDQRVAAVALRLYQFRNMAGDKSGANAAIAGLHLPKEACVLSSPPVRFVSSGINSDDYPSDLWLMGMSGADSVEVDIDTTGEARNGRLVVEDPPFVFNEITLAKIPTIHYDPARIDGKVTACIAQTPLIRWELPE